MGKVKRLELWWKLYRASLPVWDLENFRSMDFCWHECTLNVRGKMHFGQVLFRHEPEFVGISNVAFWMQFILQNGNRCSNADLSLMLTISFKTYGGDDEVAQSVWWIFYGLDDWVEMCCFQFPEHVKIFFFPGSRCRSLFPHSYLWRRETDKTPPSTAYVKNTWIYPSTLHTPSWHNAFTKHRNNLIFTF